MYINAFYYLMTLFESCMRVKIRIYLFLQSSPMTGNAVHELLHQVCEWCQQLFTIVWSRVYFIYSRVWFVVDTIKGTHVHCMISIVAEFFHCMSCKDVTWRHVKSTKGTVVPHMISLKFMQNNPVLPCCVIHYLPSWSHCRLHPW